MPLSAEETKAKLESFYRGLIPCHAVIKESSVPCHDVIEGSSGECSEDDDESSGEYYVFDTDEDDDMGEYYGDYIPERRERINKLPDIPEEFLKNPSYKMVAEFAVKELQTKFNQEKTRFELEDIVGGTFQLVAGAVISLNLKVKDQDENSYTFEASIYAFLTTTPADCKLELLSGEVLNHLGDSVFMI